jgi:hypothetical protein
MCDCGTKRPPFDVVKPFIGDRAGDFFITNIPDQELAAIEIAPNSDIDTVVVRSSSGEYVVSVGAPLIGPVPGPFNVYIPAGPKQLGLTQRIYDANGNQLAVAGNDPLVALRCHHQIPPSFLDRRATAERRVDTFAVSQGAYTAVMEIPVWGRRRGSIFLERSGAVTITYKFTSRMYVQGSTGLVVGKDVDMTGDLSMTSTTVGYTWSDDAPHTIIVQAKASSPVNLNVYSRACD